MLNAALCNAVAADTNDILNDETNNNNNKIREQNSTEKYNTQQKQQHTFIFVACVDFSARAEQQLDALAAVSKRGLHERRATRRVLNVHARFALWTDQQSHYVDCATITRLVLRCDIVDQRTQRAALDHQSLRAHTSAVPPSLSVASMLALAAASTRAQLM